MKHGMSNTRLYKVWSGMKERCYNPNSPNYRNYGERGIIMCDEWRYDFMAFYKWAMDAGYDETAPRGQYTIERNDNNGNYCPDNCRWATIKEQGNNKSSNITVESNGKKMTLRQWADSSHSNYPTMLKEHQRRVAGVKPREEYLSEADKKRAMVKQAIADNPDLSVRALSDKIGISKSQIQRVKASL